jgi:hypothetical protein
MTDPTARVEAWAAHSDDWKDGWLLGYEAGAGDDTGPTPVASIPNHHAVNHKTSADTDTLAPTDAPVTVVVTVDVPGRNGQN